MRDIINIVADIGGTNIRIAQLRVHNKHQYVGSFEHIKVFKCHEFTSLVEVLTCYLDQQKLHDKSINACLAIACPVNQDVITMTNLSWSFSQRELKKTLCFNRLWSINDYTAIAYAIPFLTEQQKEKLGNGQPKANKPIAICGPGTGLGVASLINEQGKYICVSGEGGHVDFAPVNEEQAALLAYLYKKYQHVSYEQLLSGLGLEQIYQALAAELGEQAVLSAQQITDAALEGNNIIAKKTLDHFCNILGAFAGNLALTLGALGGVYIAGGIVPRFIDYINESNFRTYFEQKGRLSNYNRNIPTYVITESQPGLLGASAYLCQQLALLKKDEEL